MGCGVVTAGEKCNKFEMQTFKRYLYEYVQLCMIHYDVVS